MILFGFYTGQKPPTNLDASKYFLASHVTVPSGVCLTQAERP